jgi:hypothetical protein
LVKITGIEKIIAVGEKSYAILNQLGFRSIKVRHPANAGARKFRQQFTKIIS